MTPEVEPPVEPAPRLAGRLPVSADTLALVRRGMWEVVQGRKGTARIARLEQIEISGKTGTAQVVSLDKIKKDDKGKLARRFQDHAWFIAYAPSEAPRIAIAVIVEHGEHGSSTAGPIARELVRTYLGPDDEEQITADMENAPALETPAQGNDGHG